MENHWVPAGVGTGWADDKVFCLARFRWSDVFTQPIRAVPTMAIAFAVIRYLQMPCKCDGCARITEEVINLMRSSYKPT